MSLSPIKTLVALKRAGLKDILPTTSDNLIRHGSSPIGERGSFGVSVVMYGDERPQDMLGHGRTLHTLLKRPS